MITLRSRYIFLPILLCLLTFIFLSRRLSWGPLSSPPPPPEPGKKPLRYKPPKDPSPPPLPEYFPLAASAHSSTDIPPIPSWNKPPNPHVPEKTRLYIGFTRYWPLLQQVVLSYIVNGWPPEDIYVVENTGTFDANKRGLLTSRNPFYLNYTRLVDVYGVNVITLPSLQTFAQLQNFYLSEAIHHNLSYYFWGHMDVVPLSHEDRDPYKSLYEIAVDTIRESQEPDFGVDKEGGEKKMWAIRFFAYDWFALVNADAFQKVGGWDSMVGYYGTDCDMHSRLGMHDMITPIADAADVWDVSDSLPDLEVLFRRKKKDGSNTGDRSDDHETSGGEGGESKDEGSDKEMESESKDKSAKAEATKEKNKRTLDSQQPASSARDPRSNSTAFGPGLSTSSSSPNDASSRSTGDITTYLKDTVEDERGGAGYLDLKATLEAMQTAKREATFRNSWQLKQRGGEGEPYYYDADGWERALQMTVENGMRINEEKWGHRGCNIRETGVKWQDAWRVEPDF